MLLEEARKTDGVLDEPEPQAYLVELGDNAVVFDLRHWTAPDQATARRVEHEVFKRVKNRLDDEGIDLPYPVRTIDATTALVEALRT